MLNDCPLKHQMDEDKPTTFQEVFLERQMKAITVMLRGLLVITLKDDIGALQLKKGRQSPVLSKY